MRDAELWFRALHPDDRERAVEEHRASNAEGERFLSEYRILAKDGREVWIRDEAVPVKAEDDTVLYWRGRDGRYHGPEAGRGPAPHEPRGGAAHGGTAA
jgi:PAS domain-containing protein